MKHKEIIMKRIGIKLKKKQETKIKYEIEKKVN
jgi:hypothetical protein